MVSRCSSIQICQAQQPWGQAGGMIAAQLGYWPLALPSSEQTIYKMTSLTRTSKVKENNDKLWQVGRAECRGLRLSITEERGLTKGKAPAAGPLDFSLCITSSQVHSPIPWSSLYMPYVLPWLVWGKREWTRIWSSWPWHPPTANNWLELDLLVGGRFINVFVCTCINSNPST